MNKLTGNTALAVKSFGRYNPKGIKGEIIKHSCGAVIIQTNKDKKYLYLEEHIKIVQNYLIKNFKNQKTLFKFGT